MPTFELCLTLEGSEAEFRVALATRPDGKVLARAVVPGPIDPPESVSESTLHSVGTRLGSLALPLPVGEAIGTLLAKGRVHLVLDVRPALQREWPWECVRHPDFGDDFLAQHPLVTFARGSVACTSPRFDASGSIRTLIVLADPGTEAYPSLPYAEREVDSVGRALAAPECDRFQVRELRHARRDTLLKQIDGFRPHVLHFAGHGISRATGGALVLEGDKGRHELIYGDELAEALRGSGTRLVVLSGCFTHGASVSVGSLLSQSGIGAVVGMREAIRDSTAHLFARAFYASLADGQPVDVAVQEGRSAIWGCGAEWASPMLTLGTQSSFEPFALPSPRLNYGLDPHPFVGRQRQRQALWTLLRSPDVRLVTLFGIGGMGKTRLARQVGEDLQHDFRDGVRLVECDVLRGRDELVGAIAEALGAETGDLPGLTRALEGKRTLILLDCFERHIEHAEVVDRLLSQCAGVKVLVTSRIVLGSPWEHTYELNEMAGKKSGSSIPSERIELFGYAARQANPALDIEAAHPAIEAIVDLLEGVPLALLLAAARLRHMSLAELDERLRTRLLDTLRRQSSRRDRHSSIRTVIEDSFDLLADWERRLAIHLSVFEGGFTLADASHVLDEDGVEDGIVRLYEQSLLVSRDDRGERRYRALDTVREYIAQVADGEELGTVRDRHAAYYAGKAELLRERIEQKSATGGIERLWKDIGNFRAGVRRAKESGDGVLLTRYARSLARAFLEAGYVGDFENLSDAAAQAASSAGDLPLLIEIRGLQGTSCRRQGDPRKAEMLWLERARLCQLAGDFHAEADSYLDIADLALKQGDLATASEMLAHYRQNETRLQSPHLKASGHLVEAHLRLAEGDDARALQCAERALDDVGEQPIPDRFVLYVWFSLAQIDRKTGRWADGLRHLRRVAEFSTGNDEAHNAAVALIEAAQILADSGDIDSAAWTHSVADRAFGRIPRVGSRVKKAIGDFESRYGRTVARLAGHKGQTWQCLVREWLARQPTQSERL